MTAQFKRWYDHDPLLVEVLDILRSFQSELKTQSQVFIDKITQEVGQEAVDAYYDKICIELGQNFGRRWYDVDPTVSKAVELLRVVPPEVQRKVAESFMMNLKEQGVQLPPRASEAP
jgi:hypothetical protein